MEFASAGDLHARIKKRKSARPLKRYSEDLIWSALIQISLGIKALHSLNIIHRDIKSSNIFISGSNDLKIGDLGVSKLMEADLARTMIGTPYYQSPEIWVQTPYSKKVDIWSLGCVIYEMATYQYPFNAQDYKSLGRKVLHGSFKPIPDCYSKELSDLINSLLVAVPSKRPGIDEILNLPSVLHHMHLVPLSMRNPNKSDILENSIHIPRDLENASIAFPRHPYPGEEADEYASDFDSEEENPVNMINVEKEINVLEEERRGDLVEEGEEAVPPVVEHQEIYRNYDRNHGRPLNRDRDRDRGPPGYSILPARPIYGNPKPGHPLPSARVRSNRKESIDGKPIMPGMNPALRLGIAAAGIGGSVGSHPASAHHMKRAESSPSNYARKLNKDIHAHDHDSARKRFPTDPEDLKLPVLPVRPAPSARKPQQAIGNRYRLHGALAPHKKFK
eukprot:TRINITY_DN4804_c0_g1_i1.p1 TRINITY_DN4804_c0_g1~~TRINITY_DN4804_c0_g1_i1.p1  ORF type:complete len:447 (+),score=79.45 TRINITY_DN4804_c0_g1_i1:702-2042(+)